MALIPLEGLGAPSQKTSLLGGVAQILINPRPSPRLADVGLFVRPKSQHYDHDRILQLHIFYQVKCCDYGRSHIKIQKHVLIDRTVIMIVVL